MAGASPEVSDGEVKGRAEDSMAKSGLSLSSTSGKKHIGGWLKSKAATLEGHVKAMGENTKMIAQDVADAAQKGLKAKKATVHEFDFIFKEKALGLEIDFSKRALVLNAKPGLQGDRLGVLTGDRLVAIDGKRVPTTEDTSSFIEEMKYRMSHAPRPVTLTFSRICEVDSTDSVEGSVANASAAEKTNDLQSVMGQLSKMPKISAGGFSFNQSAEEASCTGNADTQAEFATLREMVERYERDLLAARDEVRVLKDDAKAASDEQIIVVEEAAQLRADLADIQLSRAWDSQEARKGREDAEEARAEAAEAHAEAAECAGRLRQLGTEFVSARDAEEAAQEEASTRLNELRALEENAAAAKEHAAECVEQRSQLSQRLEEVSWMLHTTEADSAAASERSARDTGLVQQCTAELLSCREMYTEEVSQLRSEFASSREDGCELTAEAVRMRAELKKHESNTSVSQRSIQELKREVQRLRSQLLRAEEAACPSTSPIASPAELEALRALASRHEASAAGAEQRCLELAQELDRLRVGSVEALAKLEQETALDPEPSVLGRPTRQHGRDNGEPPDEANIHVDESMVGSEPLLGSSTLSTASPAPAASERLHAAKLQSRLADLEARNEALKRQLNERPIVFQFGPGPPDEEAEAPSAADDDGLENADSSVAAALGSSRMGALAVVCYAAGLLHRRLARAFAAFRRQTLAQSLERSLKNFTKSLLQRPVLLWLFYSHLLALWLIEFWRQAVSAPTALDPTSRLEAQAGSSALRSNGGSRHL